MKDNVGQRAPAHRSPRQDPCFDPLIRSPVSRDSRAAASGSFLDWKGLGWTRTPGWSVLLDAASDRPFPEAGSPTVIPGVRWSDVGSCVFEIGGGLQGLPPAGRPPAPLAVRLSCSNGSPIAAPGFYARRRRPASRLVPRPEPTDPTSTMRLVVDHAVRPSRLRSSTASRVRRPSPWPRVRSREPRRPAGGGLWHGQRVSPVPLRAVILGDITTIEDEGSVEEARQAWTQMKADVAGSGQ